MGVIECHCFEVFAEAVSSPSMTSATKVRSGGLHKTAVATRNLSPGQARGINGSESGTANKRIRG